MDRRTFLGAVTGGLVVAPVDSAGEQTGSNALTEGLAGTSKAVNFAGKVKGVNLTSKPGAPSERAYWVEWDWSGWIRPQIDCSIALGANAIRIIGDVAMVLKRSVSMTLRHREAFI